VARAVLDLYRELWDQPPAQATPTERRNVTRARKVAAAHGWPLPQAWDDDTIADPHATAADCRRKARLRPADLVEEAEELFRVHGLDRNQAAERLGITRCWLDKAIERETKARAAAQAAARPCPHASAAKAGCRRHRIRPASAALPLRSHRPA